MCWGSTARYRLERLSAEYTDTGASRPRPHHLRRAPSNDEDSLTADLTRLSARLHQMHLVDTFYGSAALMPMADGAQYALAVTQSALIARAAND
jgi:hypothetical protein